MKYWVLDNSGYTATMLWESGVLTLSNGLTERKIDAKKGTVSLVNQTEGISYLHELKQDILLTIDGREVEFYKEVVFLEYSEIPMREDLHYRPQFATEEVVYPPKGKAAMLRYSLGALEVRVIYEIFDGIPVVAKRLHIINNSSKTVVVNRIFVDSLAMDADAYAMFYAETNYNGGCGHNNNRTLSVQYADGVLNLGFDIGPDAEVAAGETFTGLRAYELLHTARYYEQKMIEVKEMYKRIAPWVLESPLIFHITSDIQKLLREAIDDISEVGFDMLIQSFGSMVNLENIGPFNIWRHKKVYTYARSKGIAAGGYTLAIIKNYRPIKGLERNPNDKAGIVRCLATEWSVKYWKNIL